jgi:hypothetical protein
MLSADVIFVNKMPFLVSISKNIKFTTGERLAGRKLNLLAKGLDHIVEYYARNGFAVRSICIDPELAEVIEEMKNKQVEINPAAAKEHVPAIERQIRTIKERVRAQRSRLPFKKLPKALIEGLVLDKIKWLNTFPTKGGLSKQYEARTLLTGVKLDFNIHCLIEIGSYAQVHEEPDITNNLEERTTGGIALGSMDNLQGGYYFLSLKTGKTLRRRNFTKLPMPADVIERVEALANSNDAEIVFEDRLGNEIDKEPDNEINPEEEVEFPEPYFLNQDSKNTGVEIEENAEEEAEQQKNEEEDEDEFPQGLIARELTTSTDEEDSEDDEDMPALLQNAEDDDSDSDDAESTDGQRRPRVKTVEDDDDDIMSYDDNDDDDDNVPAMDIPTPKRSRRVTKPPSLYIPRMKGKKYETVNFNLGEEPETLDAHIMELLFNQVSFKQNLKLWGENGYEAAFKEMDQLHRRDVFKPLEAKELTKEEKQKTMESHIFLKEKKDGSIKGRTVAEGRKQRGHVSKEDASSPTPSLDAILLSCIIDAMEGRDVATIDIPNAFVQTKLDLDGERITMKVRGKLAELLVKTEPSLYRKYIIIENGQEVLYMELLRALYGKLMSELLFYKQLVIDLESLGFKLNPYDLCVANRMVNGKQHTVVWHVDDMKSSHIDSKVNDELIDFIRKRYKDA